MQRSKGKSAEEINPQTNPREFWAAISARAWSKNARFKAVAVLSSLIALGFAGLKGLGTGDTVGSILGGVIAGLAVLACGILMEYIQCRRVAIEATVAHHFNAAAALKRQLSELQERFDDRQQIARQKIVNQLVRIYVYQNDRGDLTSKVWTEGWLCGAEPIEKGWAEQELQKLGHDWRLSEYRMDPSL